MAFFKKNKVNTINDMTNIAVMPVNVSNKPRRIANVHNIQYDTISQERYNNEILENYKKSNAYSINNVTKDTQLFTGENSLSNRFTRWKDEEFIIIPQNQYESANMFLKLLIMVLTLILIIYIYQHNLIIAPRDLVNYDNITETHKNELKHHNNINLAITVFQVLSFGFLSVSTIWSIFKRTTQSFKILPRSEKRSSIENNPSLT